MVEIVPDLGIHGAVRAPVLNHLFLAIRARLVGHVPPLLRVYDHAEPFDLPGNECRIALTRLVDVQSRAYRDQYGDNFVTVIPTNIYGPGDNYNLRDGHVIPALIHKCFVAKQIGGTFDVAGTGKPLRQFIYSDDLAWLMMWVMVNYDDAEPIILSPPEESEVSIAEVAHQVAYAFGYVDGLNITGEGGDGQFKKTACNRKLMEQIGDTGFVFTPIADGIRNSVAWFIANYDDARK